MSDTPFVFLSGIIPIIPMACESSPEESPAEIDARGSTVGIQSGSEWAGAEIEDTEESAAVTLKEIPVRSISRWERL
jgi:hypothetical protein